jgi:molecular chaperone GrpE
MADTDETRTTEGPKESVPADEPRVDRADDPATRIAELEAALAAAREEARTSHDRWLRERADLENLKKRMAREKSEAVRFGIEALVKDLLPAVDNLERALSHAQSGGNGKPLRDGVELVLKSILDVLQRHGVTRVEARGERFDPAHHEAVAHVESAQHAAGQVVEEHQPGYRLHERLLRPALVTVSKGAPAGGDLAEGGSGD